MRECADHAGPQALFSLGRYIELVYGELTREVLESEQGVIEYALAFANGEEDRSEAQAFLENESRVRKLGPEWGRLSAEGVQVLEAIRLDLTEPQLSAERLAQERLAAAGPEHSLETHWLISDCEAFRAFIALLHDRQTVGR